jgi:hypothetical protein
MGEIKRQGERIELKIDHILEKHKGVAP